MSFESKQDFQWSDDHCHKNSFRISLPAVEAVVKTGPVEVHFQGQFNGLQSYCVTNRMELQQVEESS